MDPVSQGLLGSAAAQASLQKKQLIMIWLIGMLAGMAPDLDVLIRSADNPLLFIKYHRHFTHSIFFIPIGGLIVGSAFLCWSKAMREHWKTVLLAATIAYGTHALLDVCTSYGTLLLWPFNETRYALDIFPIVHPYYTVTLLLGVIAATIFKMRKPAWFALILSTCLIFWGAYQHHRALQWQQTIAQERQHQIKSGRAMPDLATIRYWRSYYISGHNIYYDNLYIPLFGSIKLISSFQAKQFTREELPDDIVNNPTLMQDYNIFAWFSDNYLIKFSDHPLIVADGRYILAMEKPVVALWSIEFPLQSSQGQHIKWIRYHTMQTP